MPPQVVQSLYCAYSNAERDDMAKHYLITDEELEHYINYMTGKGGEDNFFEEILKAKKKIFKYLYIDASDSQKKALRTRLKAIMDKQKRKGQ